MRGPHVLSAALELLFAGLLVVPSGGSLGAVIWTFDRSRPVANLARGTHRLALPLGGGEHHIETFVARPRVTNVRDVDIPRGRRSTSTDEHPLAFEIRSQTGPNEGE